MSIFVAGATGATGRLLASELLKRGHAVTAVVRSARRIPAEIRSHQNLTLIETNILEIDESRLAGMLEGCSAIASCLGHNLSWKGIFGPPYRLVTDATRLLCSVARSLQPTAPIRFVLMNTTGNRNRDLQEKRSMGESLLVGILRALVPPQPDNEQAAEYLRSEIGQNDPCIQWAAVRPDSLIDAGETSPYEIHPSPTRSPIFNAGKTSRINVAHFMAELLTCNDTWQQWQGQMPVIYNKEEIEEGE